MRSPVLYTAILALCVAAVPVSTLRAADGPQTEVEKKAIDFLISKQPANGAWMQQVGPGVTALIVKGLLQSGKTLDDPAVKKGLDYIISTKQSDGGFYSGGQPTYHTSIVLSVLAKLPPDTYGEHVKKAQAFLKAVQAGSPENAKDDQGKAVDTSHPWYGGWGYGGTGRPDMSNAHFVIEALRDSGVPSTDETIKRALVFVTHMQSGEQNDLPWAKGQTDGGFIYDMGFNRAKNFYGGSSAPDHVDRDGKQVLTTYGSMTYAGLKSLIYCDLKKDDPRVKSVLKWAGDNWTLDVNPGMGNTSGVFYYYLTFASAFSAYGEDRVPDSKGVQHDWRKEFEDKMKAIQHADGSFANTTADRWMEQTPELATAYIVLGMQALRQKPTAPTAIK